MLSSRAKSSFARVTSRHYNYWPCTTTTRTLVMMKRMGPSPANYPYPINRNKSLSTRSRARVEIRDGCCSTSTFSFRIGQKSFSSSSNSAPTMPFRISEEIQEAVKNNGKAVVALESAIITHGMPYPDNIQTAMHLQNIIRQQGVIPATVGVIKGQLTVGLSDEEIETLGSSVKGKSDRSSLSGSSSSPPVVKVSRRDLPYALSHKLNGGTTVSGTIIGAVKAGIPIFVTGGLGGVHRGAETTFDVSADLRELGRSPIAVVSAGVKSILDIGKTLEYLETEGVCVCVLARGEEKENEKAKEGDRKDLGTNMNRIKFPSFFTAESPFPAPYALQDEAEAANLLHSAFQFGLGSGILIAVPIPKEFAASGEKIENAIQIALKAARAEGISGKDMTPFILSKVNELTGGESLVANKHLIENNARIGAQIALELASLRRRGKTCGGHDDESNNDGSAGGDGSLSSSSSYDRNKVGDYHPSRDQAKKGDTKGTKMGRSLSFPADPRHVSHALSTLATTTGGGGWGTSTAFSPCLLTTNGNANCDRQQERYGQQSHVPGYHQLSPWNIREKRRFSVGCTKNIEIWSTGAGAILQSRRDYHHHCFSSSSGRPVVIGGTSLDLVLNVQEEAIVYDGRTHGAKISTVPGGVGRNIAEALYKLGHNPLFISSIGNDLFGREILRNFSQNGMDNKGVSISGQTPTAIYSAVLNHQGECLFGMGDMTIHGEILPEHVEEQRETMEKASFVLLDGNIPVKTMTKVLEMCCQSSVPVWFEPTEIRKARKILEVPSKYWQALQYISPNLRELISISDEQLSPELGESVNGDGELLLEKIPEGNIRENSTTSRAFSHVVSQCFSKFPSLKIILLTGGARGFSVIRREDGDETFGSVHFPPPGIQSEKLKSVSGAGDCLNAGFITGLVSDLPIEECAALGTYCAKKSLETNLNVPMSFGELSVESIKKNKEKNSTHSPHLRLELE